MAGPSEAAEDPTLLSLLAPVLELGVVVAQAGQRTQPPLVAPLGLRRFLGFTHKVPPAALRAARRVLDDDADYRARVATVATRELVGEAGVLFVTRPDGWEQRVELLRADAAIGDDNSRASEGPDDRRLARRLRSAEGARARAEERIEEATAAAARSRAGETAARHLADEAQRRAGVAEARANDLAGERDRLLAELRRVRADADVFGRVTAEQRTEIDAAHARETELRDELSRARRVEEAVAQAYAAAESLRIALAEAAVSSNRTAGHDQDVLSPRPTVAVARRKGPGRTPVALPPAMFDDAPEAVAHLLRVPDMLVLVDGYNVAKWRWPTAMPIELRERLIDALVDVGSRTGCRMHVVFDGVDPTAGGVRVARKVVRVSFSPEGREADDVLLDMAAAQPPNQPVLVVSSDNRVRAGAQGLGVNTCVSPSFVASWSVIGAPIAVPRRA